MEVFPLKFVLIGDAYVGKSQLSLRFCKKKFNSDSASTVGIEFATSDITIHNYTIKAQIWDTAGQERYESMTRAYFRDAVGALLVYDITNRKSFENVKTKWLSLVKEYGHENISMVLVGNKADLASSKREVPLFEAAEFAENEGIDFIEASARSGLNVELAYRRLVLSVALLLPAIKAYMSSLKLPYGWIPASGSKTEYINIWTGATITIPPTAPADPGLAVAAKPIASNMEMSFRDSSGSIHAVSPVNSATTANTAPRKCKCLLL